jgi:hypothetical protein
MAPSRRDAITGGGEEHEARRAVQQRVNASRAGAPRATGRARTWHRICAFGT